MKSTGYQGCNTVEEIAYKAKSQIGTSTLGVNDNIPTEVPETPLEIVTSIDIDENFGLTVGTHEYVIPVDDDFVLQGYVGLLEQSFVGMGRRMVNKEAFQFWIESNGARVSPIYQDGHGIESGGIGLNRRSTGGTDHRINTGQEINYIDSFLQGDVITLVAYNLSAYNAFDILPLSYLSIKKW